MDDIPIVQSDASATNLRPKPAVPKKPVKLTSENDVNRMSTHVKDMIRRLQEKDQSNVFIKPNFVKVGGKSCKFPAVPEKEEMNIQEKNQTLEDLKAIDEDIEKLRKQIEERDKIISALREAAEAKDKKLDNLMMEYSKLQSNGKLDLDTSPESNRATSLSPSSPPLCNGELCWTDSFVNKNYHEPVYAQLLNDHTALQKIYNDLRAKLESSGAHLDELKEGTETSKTEQTGNKLEGKENNAINLIMAEQIRVLKEREAQLIWEAEELREHNELMEFRILELEECRKEFLDKETVNEGKHRTEKIVWRERDIEEISDSGVMSLPTSEDLTSDSELGEAIRNYSPLGAVTNLGLSSENPHSELSGVTDLKSKKSLKTSECLQESGIFVDAENSSDCAISQSKACQTESVLDKTLLDIIDSSCDLFLSKNPGYFEDSKLDDLSTEISKLSVIQKRIQQKTKSPTPRSVHSCPHSNTFTFYEERLSQLEEKLKIYESSGDTKDILLSKRLQKEVELAHRVKELTDKVTSLEANNKKLEEEKCEFEEAENDTRFQCQRLEIRLQELIDKNTELELEIERQKVIMNEERRREKKKGNLEGLLTKYEERNHELEEKEVESRQRLSMIEAAMPAIVAYNIFKLVQNPEFDSAMPENATESLRRIKEEQKIIQKREESFTDQKKTKKEHKKVEETPTEKALRNKIQELEEKATKDREMLEEMTNTLKAYSAAETSQHEAGSLRTDDVDLFEELKQMVANELELRAQIERLKKNEQAYMQSLEKADEIWAGMEEDYKQRMQEAEKVNSEFQQRISQLEASQAELEKALSEHNVDKSPSKSSLHEKIQELILENKKIKMDFSRKLEENKKVLEKENSLMREQLKKMELELEKEEMKYQLLAQELEYTNQELKLEKTRAEKLRKDLEESHGSVSYSLENNLQSQISELTQELNQKSKELSSLEVTVAELREEVETLENKVTELVSTIQTTIKNQEEVSLMIKSSKESTQWSLPADEAKRRLVCVSLPKPEVTPAEIVERKLELPIAHEVVFKTEKELPSFDILLPSKQCFRYVVFAVPSLPRRLVWFAFPRPKPAIRLYQKWPRHSSTAIVVKDSSSIKQNEIDPREEEIFQLSIKNTELQQALEKMEEEARQKKKEFEVLQKIAIEIHREQKNLELLIDPKKEKLENQSRRKTEETLLRVFHLGECRASHSSHSRLEESETRNLQSTNPVVVKTSEECSPLSSSLQVANDNLQSKHRPSGGAIKSQTEELKQKGDNRDVEVFVKKCLLDDEKKEKNFDGHATEVPASPDVGETHEKSAGERKTRPSTPKFLGKSSSAYSPALGSYFPVAHYGTKSVELDPEFSFAPTITTVRKVGEDGIFMEWDISCQTPNVTGFEIKVNGLLSHKVRSPTRNKALLRPLNLKEKISIHLFAMSDKGRSMRSSHVVFPEKYFLI